MSLNSVFANSINISPETEKFPLRLSKVSKLLPKSTQSDACALDTLALAPARQTHARRTHAREMRRIRPTRNLKIAYKSEERKKRRRTEPCILLWSTISLDTRVYRKSLFEISRMSGAFIRASIRRGKTSFYQSVVSQASDRPLPSSLSFLDESR